MPQARGKRYLLTMVDRATKWPEAIPLNDISAQSVTNVLYREWIARYGVPQNITTDQGRQFESKLFNALAKALGANKYTTTAYHPQSNGKVERWHRALKASIMAADVQNWVDALPTILLGLRATVQTDTGYSASQLAFGEDMRLPGDFFTENKEMNAEEMILNIRKIANSFLMQPARHGEPNVYVQKALKDCSHVYLQVDTPRTGFQRPYTGPFKVLERTDKTMTIKCHEVVKKVSIDRCKAAFMLSKELDSTEVVIPSQDSVPLFSGHAFPTPAPWEPQQTAEPTPVEPQERRTGRRTVTIQEPPGSGATSSSSATPSGSSTRIPVLREQPPRACSNPEWREYNRRQAERRIELKRAKERISGTSRATTGARTPPQTPRAQNSSPQPGPSGINTATNSRPPRIPSPPLTRARARAAAAQTVAGNTKSSKSTQQSSRK